jgi:hypothetical protein
MFLVAITLLVLMGAAAIAVDLSAMRADRSTDQKVTDSAAAAGALAVISGAGVDACEDALAYVSINAEEIGAVDDSNCANFSTACDAGMAESEPFSAGRYAITITYPVPDGHPLMTSGILGAQPQGLVSGDGSPCERVGVEMSATHDSFFAQLLGFDQGTTTVHTVAAAVLPSGEGVPLNLLVLDRFGCEAIDVQGNGGVIVSAVVSEDGTGLQAGVAAADSDGSAGCTMNGVIDIDGDQAVLRADGPEGCLNQTGTGSVGGFTSGHGCGAVQTLAPGTPGCNVPACTGSGGNGPNPEPTALPARLTRAPIDYRYNCWGNYSSPPGSVGWAVDPLTSGNQQDIPGCTAGTGDHIYDLITTVGQSGANGHARWTTLGYPCDLPSSHPAVSITGDVYVDCSTFNVRTSVRIDGNVIFDGHVNVTSATGHLNVQNTLGAPGWVFFRGQASSLDALGSAGTLTKDGQAHLTFQYTAVYLSKTSRVAMAGGTGSLTWVAPDSGVFDDLALWSDSPYRHDWAGQANLEMEGVFFTPWATGEYAGTSGQNQTKAQWVADKLVARGQGQLVIQPEFGRAVEFPISPRTVLIR